MEGKKLCLITKEIRYDSFGIGIENTETHPVTILHVRMPRSFDETVEEMFDVLQGNGMWMDINLNGRWKEEQLDTWTASMKTQSKWAEVHVYPPASVMA